MSRYLDGKATRSVEIASGIIERIDRARHELEVEGRVGIRRDLFVSLDNLLDLDVDKVIERVDMLLDKPTDF